MCNGQGSSLKYVFEYEKDKKKDWVLEKMSKMIIKRVWSEIFGLHRCSIDSTNAAPVDVNERSSKIKYLFLMKNSSIKNCYQHNHFFYIK